jgi:predicted aldo/keto reductase-like oxidoreductase
MRSLAEEGNNGNINLQAFTEMADYYIEQGFTYFDTGYPYHSGASETVAREAIVKRYPREAFMLADKMPVWEITSRSDYQKIFDRQLERCGVEYFDNYLLHNLGEKHYADTLKHDGFSFMQKLKETGKARSVPKLRQANHCTACGQCTPKCTQRINIPAQMERIDRFVEQLKSI